MSNKATDYCVRFDGPAAKEDSITYLKWLKANYASVNTAGVDEVGRGALISDVVAACVVLPINHGIVGIADSKKISEKKRIRLDKEISEKGIYGIGVATNEEIDKFNIFRATHMAAQRAYIECASKCDIDLLLCDGGLDIREHLNIPSRSIIKGDIWSEQISAASIIAKVYRDNQMYFYDDLWPEYGLRKNKGYGTKDHLEAIEKYGITPIHRRSFRPCKNIQERTHG